MILTQHLRPLFHSSVSFCFDATGWQTPMATRSSALSGKRAVGGRDATNLRSAAQVADAEVTERKFAGGGEARGSTESTSRWTWGPH